MPPRKTTTNINISDIIEKRKAIQTRREAKPMKTAISDVFQTASEILYSARLITKIINNNLETEAISSEIEMVEEINSLLNQH